jgi:sortase A
MAGHRTTHGQPFIRIDEVQVGDDIVVTTLAGRFVYVMTGQQIVSPNDYQLVIPTIDPSVATLTLTSCHPKYSARQRIVVTAVLDAQRSDAVTLPWTAGVPDQPEPSGVIPGEDAPASTAVPSPDSTSPDSTVTAATTETAPATTVAVDPGTDNGTGADNGTGTDPLASEDGLTDEQGEELFANRWFSDPGAYPHVGLWGVALIAVALAATALSRRVRRNWVGALVGIVPFVVVLYFWFENVNRLLPPNL